MKSLLECRDRIRGGHRALEGTEGINALYTVK